jgi:hypothetical protein
VTAVAICDAFVSSAVVMQKLWRVWAINGDVALADDTATAAKDATFGTGLRPASFFLALIAVEYAFGKNYRLFSGREGKRGATHEIRDMQERITAYLATLSPEELAQQFARGSGGNFGAGGKNTWARHFYEDVADFWTALDGWGANFLLFFRVPPAPAEH